MRKSSPRGKTLAQNVAIIDIAEEGKGVGRAGELVVFVDKAVPGDVADVEIFRKKKNFAEAKITALKTASAICGQNLFASILAIAAAANGNT